MLETKPTDSNPLLKVEGYDFWHNYGCKQC